MSTLEERVSEVIAQYVSAAFAPGRSWIDLDDDDYTVLVVENRIVKNRTRGVDTSLLNIVRDKRSGAMAGHYLRFYGDSKRFNSLIRAYALRANPSDLFFSEDFEQLFLHDGKRGCLLEAFHRGRNYYVLSLLRAGEGMYANLVASLQENHLKYEDLLRSGDRAKVKAARRIVTLASRQN